MLQRKSVPIWWEKTVEYAYVAKLALEKKLDYAAPLSGTHEHDAGDGFFGSAVGFIMVEFKRKYSDLPSEISMFNDYDLALEIFGNYYHHFFIYGNITENRLELRATKYFGKEIDNLWYDTIDILACGIPSEEFLAYLKVLASLKKADGRSGGKHVSPESFSTVLGISQDGQVVETITLQEFAPRLFPAPQPPAPPSSSSTPSLRPS